MNDNNNQSNQQHSSLDDILKELEERFGVNNHEPPKPNFKKKSNGINFAKFTQNQIIGSLTLVLLVAGAAVGMFLGTQNQEIRQQASTAYPTCLNTSGICFNSNPGATCVQNGVSGHCENTESSGICVCVPGPTSTPAQVCNGDADCGPNMFCDQGTPGGICTPLSQGICCVSQVGARSCETSSFCTIHSGVPGGACDSSCGGPANTNTPTRTPTRTPTKPPATAIPTITPLPTAIPATNTPIPTAPPGATNTPTRSPTPTITGPLTWTPSPTRTNTPSPTLTRTPTPVGATITPAPTCNSIVMEYAVGLPDRPPKQGDSVQFVCAAGGNSYEFQIRLTQGTTVGPWISVPAIPGGNRSTAYTLAQPGHYSAQCRMCFVNAGITSCQQWEAL